MGAFHLWLIGESEHREFQQVTQFLQQSTSVTIFQAVDLACAANQEPPDLIVLAQVLPGQIAVVEVEQLRKQFPLTRIVGLLGSWCEGEFRSGNPWPGVNRLYWHHALSRLEQDLQRWQTGETPTWNLPITVTHEEQLLHIQPSQVPSRHGLIAVYSPNNESAKWLGQACESCGYHAVAWHTQMPLHLGKVAAVVWDDNQPDLDQTHLEATLQQFSPAPMIAVLTFPRYEVKQRLLSLGVQTVLSKPLFINDLQSALDQATLNPCLKESLE